MVSCCVPLCKNEKGKVKNVSFHEFPCDSDLRGKWIEAVPREGECGGHWQPADRSVVCSEHFTIESYREDCKRRVLKAGAVPSIFAKYPKYLKDPLKAKDNIAVHCSGGKMVTKIEIKEENVADQDPMKAKDNIAVHCSDGKMVTKIEIKEENLDPFIDLQNEADIFTSHDVMNITNTTVIHTDDCEIDIKREIKEEVIFSHINLGNKTDFSSDNVIDIRSDSCIEAEDCEMDNKMKIKEELWGVERILTEPECQSISALHMQNKKKGSINEDLQPAKTPRSCREEEVHGNDTLEGNVCLSKSEGAQECKQHGNILCDSNLFCKQCHLNFEDKTSYMHEIHEKTFTAKPSLKKNNLIHKKTLKCGVCEKVFTRREHLNAHIIIHDIKRLHRCNICKKRFTCISSLGRHKLIHEGKKPSDCDKTCANEKQWTNNLVSENKKLYKCNTCCKRFTRMSSLKRHNLVHEGKRPFKCDICEKSFTEKSTLSKHNLIHEGKQQHQCIFCDKKFTYSSSLYRHILIHENIRPYKCDICEKSFADRSTLRKHNLIHEGKKQHQCNFCDKKFTHGSSLYRHVLIHEGRKPHKCNICEKSFTQKSGLSRHIMTHEGKKHTSVMFVKGD